VPVAPPAPPAPPREVTVLMLAAGPVLPESASERDRAPELAFEVVSPVAVAAPVAPVSPERPEVAVPAVPVARPRMALLVATPREVAMPVMPLAPVLPEVADGVEVALDVAPPVAPVLGEDERRVGGALVAGRAVGLRE